MTRRLSILLSVALVAGTLTGSYAGDEWDEADQKVVRLAPRAFSQLPEGIIAYLEKRRCLVPQEYIGGAPHNVIRGEFSVAGQTDLAVLCSVDRVSTILVFWKLSTDSVAEIAQLPDRNMLHGIGDGKIGYSRRLSIATPEIVRRFPKAPGDPGQPTPTHDGIEDELMDKFSDIWYFDSADWQCIHEDE